MHGGTKMSIYQKKYKKTAEMMAKKMRNKGYKATVQKKDKGYGVYVYRK